MKGTLSWWQQERESPSHASLLAPHRLHLLVQHTLTGTCYNQGSLLALEDRERLGYLVFESLASYREQQTHCLPNTHPLFSWISIFLWRACPLPPSVFGYQVYDILVGHVTSSWPECCISACTDWFGDKHGDWSYEMQLRNFAGTIKKQFFFASIMLLLNQGACEPESVGSHLSISMSLV